MSLRRQARREEHHLDSLYPEDPGPQPSTEVAAQSFGHGAVRGAAKYVACVNIFVWTFCRVSVLNPDTINRLILFILLIILWSFWKPCWALHDPIHVDCILVPPVVILQGAGHVCLVLTTPLCCVTGHNFTFILQVPQIISRDWKLCASFVLLCLVYPREHSALQERNGCVFIRTSGTF